MAVVRCGHLQASGDGGAGRSEREAAAERELERVFNKQHFRELKVRRQMQSR